MLLISVSPQTEVINTVFREKNFFPDYFLTDVKLTFPGISEKRSHCCEYHDAYIVQARANLQRWQLRSEHFYRWDAEISHYSWQRCMQTKTIPPIIVHDSKTMPAVLHIIRQSGQTCITLYISPIRHSSASIQQCNKWRVRSLMKQREERGFCIDS